MTATHFKDNSPVEYELYKRCYADSILAVPFWHNPTGFMIVRNPKRFIDRGVAYRQQLMLHLRLLLKENYYHREKVHITYVDDANIISAVK